MTKLRQVVWLLVLIGLTIVACSPKSTPPISVSGTVHSALGEPYAGIVVMAQGKTATSGANGQFVLEGITAPYDLAVIAPVTPPIYTVHAGLTSTAPDVFVERLSQPDDYQTILTVSLAAPLSAGQRAIFCVQPFSGAQMQPMCETMSAGNSIFDFYLYWGGAASQAVTVHTLLQTIDPPSGRPVSYQGYAATGATVQNGVGLTVTPATTPVATTASVTLNRVPQTGYAPFVAVATVRVATDYYMPVALIESAQISGLTFPVPVFGELQLGVGAMFASATETIRGYALTWQFGAEAGATTMTMPPMTTLTSPAAEASNVTASTSFVLNGTNGSLRKVEIWPRDDYDLADVHVFTTNNSATIPDLSSIGYSLLPGTRYRWSATEYFGAPGGSTEPVDLALDNQLAAQTLFQGGRPPLTVSGAMVESASRNFSTP